MTKHAPQTVSRNSNNANTAFMIGLFTILAALVFEHIVGYIPCELCLAQRTPYYVGLPILAIIIGAWNVTPARLRILLTLGVAGLFVWGTYLGAYHSGVEWGFWPGPTACTGTGEGLNFGDLGDLNATRVVPCDEPQVRFFGLSFAGLNAIASLIITAFLLRSVWGQFVRMRNEAASSE